MPSPAAANPIDQNSQGLIGKPVDRVEGPLKVTGRAPYTYEYAPEGKVAYGFIVNSPIPKGKIAAIDAAEAEAAPGVLLVMTYKNVPDQSPPDPAEVDNELERPKPYLYDEKIRHYGEPVAFVVAESFEEARNAAGLVKIDYQREDDPRLSLAKLQGDSYDPGKLGGGQKAGSSLGDFDAAFASAPVTLDATYTTPYHHSQPMEPHASMAEWKDGKLTIHVSHQMPVSAHNTLMKTLKLGKDDVRILCKYVGGGFGSKLSTESDAVLAAQAARKLNRPVKIAFTRQQVFFNATHRAESIQRIRLGSTNDGVLTAIGHDVWVQTAPYDQYVEQAALQTRSLYAAPNRRTSHRLVKLDLSPAGSVRAPGEAIGMLALEQAMDELAEKLGIDPIELRRRNEPAEDPERKIPFATRKLTECLQEGARRFGWNNRPPKPGSLRDGRWLVGYGVASAYRSNFFRPAEATVSLDRSGKLTAKTAMTDIGTGTYTILAQIAAETMQMPLEAVIVEIGDSELPPSPGSGGSFGANSSGSALYEACMNLRQRLAEAAVGNADSPLSGLNADEANFAGSMVTIGNKGEAYQAIVQRAGGTLEGKASVEPPETYKTFSQAAYGAHFVEIGVDSVTGEIRLRRMLGVFAAGRILNEKTARSQAIGGMTWGFSAAVMEGSVVDQRYGQFVNHDLAEYHVPVHADMTNIDAVYLPEVDDKTGPLKIKGVGEVGICGAGAAVANAIYNACGVRVRDYPITLDKILPGLA